MRADRQSDWHAHRKRRPILRIRPKARVIQCVISTRCNSLHQSINQSIKVFLEWPKWRSRCKVHYRCKKSVTEARKRLAEQMSFQLSLEGWQRFSGNDVVGKRVLNAASSQRTRQLSADISSGVQSLLPIKWLTGCVTGRQMVLEQRVSNAALLPL